MNDFERGLWQGLRYEKFRKVAAAARALYDVYVSAPEAPAIRALFQELGCALRDLEDDRRS